MIQRFFSLQVLLILGLTASWTSVAEGQTEEQDPSWPPILPTDNQSIYQEGGGPDFYMGTDRQIKPGFDLPWMGGRYGYTRNGVQTRWGVLYPRFHEGIDIRPLSRTSRGEPLDEVRSISDGIVVHSSSVSNHSNYGRYVVVEHWWHGSPYYSLYAHLKSIDVWNGKEVQKGERLGILGYTGRGINRRRAHVHLEVNLLINMYFQQCFVKHFPGQTNYHGPYNGMNMKGIDVEEMYLRLKEDPSITIEDIVADIPPFFSVTVPADGRLDILYRYPWLSSSAESDIGLVPDLPGLMQDDPVSWRISLSRSGIPLRVEPLETEVDGFSLEILESSPIPYRYLTALVSGSGNSAELTGAGRRLIEYFLCAPPESTESYW